MTPRGTRGSRFFEMPPRLKAIFMAFNRLVVASAAGEERARAWARIVALAPGYGRYALTTDREIPVVRLRGELDRGAPVGPAR